MCDPEPIHLIIWDFDFFGSVKQKHARLKLVSKSSISASARKKNKKLQRKFLTKLPFIFLANFFHQFARLVFLQAITILHFFLVFHQTQKKLTKTNSYNFEIRSVIETLFVSKYVSKKIIGISRAVLCTSRFSWTIWKSKSIRGYRKE